MQESGVSAFQLTGSITLLPVLKLREDAPRKVPPKAQELWLRGVGMKTRFESKKLGSWLLAGTLLCSLQLAMASPAQNHKRAVKKAPPPPLPSGPTGPVQQIPLDSIAAVPPQVTYENNELTIVAPNSTLA